MDTYQVVRDFEAAVADYANAPYGVAVESCTSALLLSCAYCSVCDVNIPKRTYVGVPMSILHAGGTVSFRDENWEGCYELEPWDIIDSARRFRRGMYMPSTLYCVSFHWEKHLKLGRGGMVLTDDKQAAEWLRVARFDGRTEGMPPALDNFTIPGWHCYMPPEVAARGLTMLSFLPDDNPDLPNSAYPDLSLFPLFKKKGRGWWRE